MAVVTVSGVKPAPVDPNSTDPLDLTGPAGPVGPAGPQGPPGADSTQAGPKGDVGPEGPKGDKGEKGDVGPQGPAGPAGAASNVAGPVGPIGPQGLQGGPGPVGPKGDKGDTGADSTVAGPAGPQGLRGPQGLKGDTGERGPVGNDGPAGPEGPRGPRGDVGAQGVQGNTGAPGETLRPSGVVGKEVDLPKAPPLLTVLVVQSNKHLYIYDPSSNACVSSATANAPGYTGAPAGWVDLGEVQGPQGEQGPAGVGLPVAGLNDGDIAFWDGGFGQWTGGAFDTRKLDDVSNLKATDGQTLVWSDNAGGYVPGHDTPDGTADGQTLVWDHANKAWKPGKAVSTLQGLTDVAGTPDFADGDVLKFDGTAKKWTRFQISPAAQRPIYVREYHRGNAEMVTSSFGTAQDGYSVGLTPERSPLPDGFDTSRIYRVDAQLMFDKAFRGSGTVVFKAAGTVWNLSPTQSWTMDQDAPMFTGSLTARGDSKLMHWFTFSITPLLSENRSIGGLYVTWTALT